MNASVGRTQEESYVSIDSAPPMYSWKRSPLICVSFLFLFALVSAGLLYFSAELRQVYFILLTQVGSPGPEMPNTLGFRLFFLALVLTFWVFGAGSWRYRAKLMAYMSLGCTAAILLADILFFELHKIGGPHPFSLAGNIINGYVTLIVFGIVIIRLVELPRGVVVHTKLHEPPVGLVILLVAIAISIAVALSAYYFALKYIESLRDVALLGGLGPGIVLFTPIFMWVTFFMGTWRKRVFPKPTMKKPSVAFLVVALNEAPNIEDCIQSLDMAANNYDGRCRLYFIDNGSTDDTFAIAKRQMALCDSLTGEVLRYPKPGKACALNFGLKMIKEEIVVRVDADTRVEPSLLVKVVPHFSDPIVGGVGGLPLPKDTSYLLAKMRSIEVYYNIAFQRVGQAAIDAVNVIPGIMSAYRREIVEGLGGFVEGMNGEDTDLTVRVGRLGYRIITDPRIRVYSEVPRTLGHLREQRIRWSRSFFHVFGRNASIICLRQGARGLWGFPLAFVSVFRRAIIVPILLYAGVVAIIDPSALYLRDGAAVAAVIVGPALLMNLGVLTVHRRWDLLPLVPAYLVFRLLRTYIAMETLFTLLAKEPAGHRVRRPKDAQLAPSGQIEAAAGSLRST